MIINEEKAVARLSSPMNLMNRLAAEKMNPRKSAMGLFGMGLRPATPDNKKEEPVKTVDIKTEDNLITKASETSFNPFSRSDSKLPSSALIPREASPTIEQLIDNSEEQVKLSIAHDKALELLNSSVALLTSKLDDIKADKLPGVITAASKVVDNIRRERAGAKNGVDKEVHYHFYTPQQKKITDYEIIDVAGVSTVTDSASQ